MNFRLVHSILLTGVLLAAMSSAAAATPADRLLALARNGAPPAASQTLRDASDLLAQLNVPGWMRHDYSLSIWETTVVPAGSRVPELVFQIAVVNGPVIIERARNAIVIASGDVTVESGSKLLVVTGGNIRFAHDSEMDSSGVFVARGSMTTPWMGNAVVHAAAGLHLSDSSASSANVIAVDTSVRTTAIAEITHRSAGAVFSDSTPRRTPLQAARPSPEVPYAGKRCVNGPPLREVSQHVPRIAREKAKCSGSVSLLIASCIKPDAVSSEELWTVHLCTNVIAEVAAKNAGGKSEFAYYSRLPPEPAGRLVTVPNAPTTYGTKPPIVR